MTSRLLAAACHVSPVRLSARDTTQKCISFINKASRNSAKLVVFPESCVPAFPVWSAIHAPTQNHRYFELMAKESVYIDGSEILAIRNAAKNANSVVSIGISEKVRYSTATLFNSNLIIGSSGDILVHHRKLMPTFFEKLTWSPGDGYGLRIAETQVAKIGALICGENTNPLARYALMAQGEQVHISTWPAIWPTSLASDRTDQQKGAPNVEQRKNYDNVTANKTRAAAHCFENKCFGIMCAGFMGSDTITDMASYPSEPEYMTTVLNDAPRGVTKFLDPTGAPLPSYILDTKTATKTEKEYLQAEEDILYAELDLNKCIEGKQYHDVVGGYQRLDVFDLRVNRKRREPVSFGD